MDLNLFLDTVNNNNIQHYGSHESFTDVTFALFRAVQVEGGLTVTGHWMNINSVAPIIDGFDQIFIKDEDICKWVLHRDFPRRA